MSIDEEGQHTLIRYRTLNGKSIEIPTDHYTIITELDLQKTKRTDEELKVWNINEQSLIRFNKLTSNITVNENWSNNNETADVKYQRWSKQLKSTMYKSFNKVTIRKISSNSIVRLKIQQQKKEIKNQISILNKKGIGNGVVAKHLKTKLERTIEDIANEIQKERAEKIQNRMDRAITAKTGKSNELWKIRKDVIQKWQSKIEKVTS